MPFFNDDQYFFKLYWNSLCKTIFTEKRTLLYTIKLNISNLLMPNLTYNPNPTMNYCQEQNVQMVIPDGDAIDERLRLLCNLLWICNFTESFPEQSRISEWEVTGIFSILHVNGSSQKIVQLYFIQ